MGPRLINHSRRLRRAARFLHHVGTVYHLRFLHSRHRRDPWVQGQLVEAMRNTLKRARQERRQDDDGAMNP